MYKGTFFYILETENIFYFLIFPDFVIFFKFPDFSLGGKTSLIFSVFSSASQGERS